jgi:EAL domain-containing protein (putative c-di-GMP-specific phosphodiesterase class I)/AmiR/NasT family two-component response regulator
MDFSRLNVMVVEDHEFQRGIAMRMLKSLGVVHASEAADGNEALAILEALEVKPDIVISDLDMPGMDGIEFIRHLAQKRLAAAIAITSGLDAAMLRSVGAMATAYGLQVLGTIEKPLTTKRLTEMLGHYDGRMTLLERYRQMSPSDLSADQLRDALTRDRIRPYFQPKIDLCSGAVVGVEALARWCPQNGNESISPALFVPAMEVYGLIDPLTELILDRACRAQTAWARSGLDLTVSVNISMLSLADVSNADRYHDLVIAAGGDPHKITFEVTESSVMKDPAQVLDILTRLRLKGFSLAVDDYGTGYSSMQLVKTLPFTELKIDGSYVHGATEDPRKRTMIETALDLARQLTLKTVAEGAETAAEWDLLIALGCHQIQGWFIAKAMPADAVPEWARLWRPPPR